MRKFFGLVLIGLVLIGFVIAPNPFRLAEADNSTAVTVDLVAPEITDIKVPDKIYAGSEFKIQTQITDNRGLKSASLFFRPKGSVQYIKQEMTAAPGTNEYYSVIKNVPSAGVEYYLEAIDLAGNLVRNGQDFSPHSIKALSELDSSIIKNLKQGRLDGHEILTLFSNNTVDGYHVRKNFSFTRYFAADGRLIDTNSKNKGKHSGRWRVAGKSLCEKFEGQSEACREIVKENDIIKKYATTRKGNRVVAIVYKRFRYGNPENY